MRIDRRQRLPLAFKVSNFRGGHATDKSDGGDHADDDDRGHNHVVREGVRKVVNELSGSRFHHLPDIGGPVHYLRSYVEQKNGAAYSDDRNYGFHL